MIFRRVDQVTIPGDTFRNGQNILTPEVPVKSPMLYYSVNPILLLSYVYLEITPNVIIKLTTIK